MISSDILGVRVNSFLVDISCVFVGMMRVSCSVGVIFVAIYRYSGVSCSCCVRAVLGNKCCKVCISPFPALHKYRPIPSRSGSNASQGGSSENNFMLRICPSAMFLVMGQSRVYTASSVITLPARDCATLHAVMQLLLRFFSDAVPCFHFRLSLTFPIIIPVAFPCFFCMSLVPHFLQPSTLFIYVLSKLSVLYEV